MSRRSIRFRLTVWYAAFLTAGLGLFGGLIWLALRQRLIADIDRELEARAGRFEQFFRVESAEAGGGQLRDELQEFCQALPPSSAMSITGSNGFTFRYSVAPRDSRIIRKHFAVAGNTFDIEAAAPIGDVLHTLDLLRVLLWSLLPVVIVIACVGGAWLSGRALKPVNEIAAAALTISIENLSNRLPVPQTGDELARLSEVLNTMLARLDSAVKTLAQFVANASHELRTPLAVIRTTAELALRRSRTPESYRDSLQEIAAESERMTQLVEELLLLARSDTEAAEMPREPLDVHEILRGVSAELRSLAELRQIQLHIAADQDPAMISGNPAALRRLFVALLDNAIKYSRDGGTVAVAIERKDSRIAVTIEDSGPGISQADLPHIFERFYRSGRAAGDGGHGLGLSLADSIARAHGATIHVRSSEGSSSVFQVSFAAHAPLSANLQISAV